MGAQYSSVKASDDLTRNQTRNLIRAKIDRPTNGFNWHVYAVAASGFFTDSYNLFSTNVILPSLAYVYWPDDCSGHKETTINILTLTGSVLGALIFGFLADKFGRTRWYGIEVTIVIVSTLVIAIGGPGFNSIEMFPLVAAFRFLMGIGVGAEYPLSAVITTEWAPTRLRGRMMAAVFLMQPLGQFIAQLFGLAVLIGYNRSYNHLLERCHGNTTVMNGCLVILEPSGMDQSCKHIVDKVWRWVAGLGAVPAVIAVLFRFSIGDPGLYDLDVQNEGGRALHNTNKVYPGDGNNFEQEEISMETFVTREDMEIRQCPVDSWNGLESVAKLDEEGMEMGGPVLVEPEDPLPEQFTLSGLKDFFFSQGNWRYVLATSIIWFVLDCAFYGLGLGNPRILAQLWKANKLPVSGVPNMPQWYTDPTTWNSTSNSTISIYDILHENARQSMLTLAIGSISGILLLIILIDYIPRKYFLIGSYLWVGLLLVITGGAYLAAWDSDSHAASITLMAVTFFFFSFGANTLTFIIPAEIFPTRYRCTCHGIAAAAGKLGSVISTASLSSLKIANDWNNDHLGYVFITFGLIMTLAAPFAWAWLPEVQDKRDNEGGWKAPNKTLEDLGRGVKGARGDGQLIGFRDKLEPTTESWRLKMGMRPAKKRTGHSMQDHA